MSKEIFEKNLAAMEKWYPPFAEVLRKKEFPKEEIEIIPEHSWDGEIIFKIQKQGRCLYLNGKRNAKEPVAVWSERLGKLSSYAPVFLFGLGSGMYLKELVKNTKEKVNIIVYEPSAAIFIKMLEEIDLSEEIKNRPIAFWIEGINAEGFDKSIEKVLALENMEFFREEIHPNYKEFYAEEILPHIKAIEKYVTQIMVNYRTGKKFSINMAQNLFKNLRYVCDGYHTKRLSDVIPHDRAAVLVSAGPSLNKNISELKRAKNKLFIIAVDTAIKPLLKEGIKPDIFCTIDSNKDLKLFDIEGVEQLNVAAPVLASHKVLERQKGKKIFFESGCIIPVMLYHINRKKFPSVAIGGSVACSAFSLLYKMGFKTIILVGQDLALTNNRTHADGTFEQKMPELNTENLKRVKGNYEETVPTRNDYKLYLDWFDMYIKGAKEHVKELRVINATEGGAYIEGTEIMTLKEALDETLSGVEEVDFEAGIASMESDFTEEERRKAVDYLHEIPEKYEQMKKNAQLLKKRYQRLRQLGKSKTINKSACTKQLKRIKKLTEKIANEPEYQMIMSTIPVADYVVRTEYYYENEDNAGEILEITRKGILYSEILEQCAGLLKEMAEEELLKIE